MSLKLYDQEDMDVAKIQAHLRGQLDQFILDKEGNPDLRRIKQVAQFLDLSIKEFADHLPHDAVIAAELLETTLEMFIKVLP